MTDGELTEQVSFKCSTEQLRALEAAAAAESERTGYKVGVATVTRRAVVQYLNRRRITEEAQ